MPVVIVDEVEDMVEETEGLELMPFDTVGTDDTFDEPAHGDEDVDVANGVDRDVDVDGVVSEETANEALVLPLAAVALAVAVPVTVAAAVAVVRGTEVDVVADNVDDKGLTCC